MPFRYTSPTGRKFTAPRRLSDPELEELFKEDTPPTSQQKEPGFQVASLKDMTKIIMKGPVPEKYIPTTIRVGGSIATAMAGFPLLGGAASELGAEAIEKSLGYREKINPKEVAVGAVVNKFAPGIEGSVVGGALKGGAYGAGSVTLNAWARGEDTPTAGQLAIGTLTGALLTGGARRFIRPSLYEISTKDVAEQTHAILSGEPLRDVSEATREGANEVRQLSKQLKLPGIKFRPA